MVRKLFPSAAEVQITGKIAIDLSNALVAKFLGRRGCWEYKKPGLVVNDFYLKKLTNLIFKSNKEPKPA